MSSYPDTLLLIDNEWREAKGTVVFERGARRSRMCRWLHDAESQHNRWTDGNWRSLVDEFGQNVALAFRDGSVGYWRQNTPLLRSEGAVANTTPFSTIFGLTGLLIEARDTATWPSLLLPAEAEIASQYGIQ